jgi:hypothetical protein
MILDACTPSDSGHRLDLGAHANVAGLRPDSVTTTTTNAPTAVSIQHDGMNRRHTGGPQAPKAGLLIEGCDAASSRSTPTLSSPHR